MTSRSSAAGSTRRSRWLARCIAPADGVLVTSATLRGGEGWPAAEARTGALHLPGPATHFEAESPFDYAGCSEVLIVTDVKQGDMASLAGAYARLIEAAGGGTLGLFTAIQRLKAVHARIADRLARAGLPLLAQHVDPIDAGTLVDIFRDDPRASLLGTDALRDGVDVPGESLRLVVMERVPWPRPTVLHAARRMAGGGSAYDDRVVRARLAQAFGRLIRRAGRHRRVRHLVRRHAVAAALRISARACRSDRIPLETAIERVDRAARRKSLKGGGNGAFDVKTLAILRHAKSELGSAERRRFRPALERPRLESGAADRARAQGQRRCASTYASRALRRGSAKRSMASPRATVSSRSRSGSNGKCTWRTRRLYSTWCTAFRVMSKSAARRTQSGARTRRRSLTAMIEWIARARRA